MLRQISFCFNAIGIILLTSKVNADSNVTETAKASVLGIETVNQTEASVKIDQTIPYTNKTIEMHRITQPVTESHSPTQHIGRTLLPTATNTSNNQQKGTSSLNLKPSDFRPSPQVDTYYEYNRFPVVPAFPESKHFGGINLNEKPIRSETLPWLDRPITNFPSTTQQPWYNKINFPTTQNPFLSVRNHPYPYLITGSYPETTTKSQYPYVITGTTQDTTTRAQYPFIITGTNTETTTGNPGFGSSPGFGSFSKFGGFPLGNSAIPGSGQTQGGFSSKFGGFDKASLFNKGSLFGGKGGGLSGASGGATTTVGAGGTSDSSLLQKTHFEQPHSISALGASSSSPWKKIIKFLTAIIPIGLLIGALTPTVINVAPMNMTQMRSRSEENKNVAAERLISSLNYINKLNSAGCEERVVCELLLGAGSSTKAEQHAEKLLETFTEQERDVIDQIQELSKIFEAVKSGDCNLLPCDGIQANVEKTTGEDTVNVKQ